MIKVISNVTSKLYDRIVKEGQWRLIKIEGPKYVFEQVDVPEKSPEDLRRDLLDTKIATTQVKLDNSKLSEKSKKKLQARIAKLEQYKEAIK